LVGLGYATPITVAAAPTASPGRTPSYDESWYAADLWSGSFPDGFSVLAPTTISLRAAPDPNLPRTIKCTLSAGATYHPWNDRRVAADKLVFRSYTRIVEATMPADWADTLILADGRSSALVDLRKGDTVRFLAQRTGWGDRLVEIKGRRYWSDRLASTLGADLQEVVTFSDRPDTYYAWINLPCSNGTRGWFFMNDIGEARGLARYAAVRDLARSELAAAAADKTGHDQSWHEDGWSREVPIGFAVQKPVTIAIRPSSNLELSRSIACRLEPASYHPYNFTRNEAENIVFRSFTKIVEGTVKTPFEAELYDHAADKDVRIRFKAGDRWRYLAYGGEGFYAVEVNGRRYGSHELIQHSTVNGRPMAQVLARDLVDPTRYQEWVNLPCANGVRGWLFKTDIESVDGFVPD
jgi:hypothetical protein